MSKVLAQPLEPSDWGLKAFTINDKSLGEIRFYVDTTHISKKAPLFFEINGSGGTPLVSLIQCKDIGQVFASFGTNNIEQTKENYHYVILDKPGTPFSNTLKSNTLFAETDFSEVLASYPYSAEYTKRLSLNWRVEATQKVIAYLIKHNFWDKTDIVAYGYSEGGQVVPALALKEKRISHIVSLVGSGLNQFYDAILDFRIQAECGTLTHQQAQDSIDERFRIIEDIYKNPLNTAKELGGHSYLRGASFCAVDNLSMYQKLTIPIFMVVGSADKSSPILGLDYVRLDFLRLGKTNLTYRTCVGCNHGLTSSENGTEVNHDYLPEILEWVKKN